MTFLCLALSALHPASCSPSGHPTATSVIVFLFSAAISQLREPFRQIEIHLGSRQPTWTPSHYYWVVQTQNPASVPSGYFSSCDLAAAHRAAGMAEKETADGTASI
jgi:hypothetical protein